MGSHVLFICGKETRDFIKMTEEFRNGIECYLCLLFLILLKDAHLIFVAICSSKYSDRERLIFLIYTYIYYTVHV